jgi:multidrug resistance protein, MATE family
LLYIAQLALVTHHFIFIRNFVVPTTAPAQPLSLIQQTLQEWRALAVLGAPILIAQLAQMANGVIDTMMAGHASARDLAAVGIGTGIWVPVLLFFIGTLSALQPLISGHRGAGEFSRIMPLTWQGIYIALVGSLVTAAPLLNVQPLLTLLQLDAPTAAIAQGYLTALTWGIPATLLLHALRGLTDGLGHTRIVMAFSLLSTLLNLPLNYIFIYGKLGLPAMGGVGCGWATTLSNWLALLALLAYLNRSKAYQAFHLIDDWVKPNLPDIKHILHIGLPIGLTLFVEVSMFCAIALFLAPLGPTVIAGHQIVLNAVSLFFMIPLSLGMALTLRISYLLGAQEYAKARLLSRTAIFLALGIACINAPILYFGRQVIAQLYTDDVSVRAIAVQLLTLSAIFQIVDVIQVTMINLQRGYKDTKLPMFIILFSFWGVCLPLGYILTFKDWLHVALGAEGFWLALIVGLSCAAGLLTVRMFRFQAQLKYR